MKCTIISGAPNDDVDFIIKNTDQSSFIIAADSGYLKIKDYFQPNLIVGDFDSSPIPKTECEVIVLPKQKDCTDTFFAVNYAVDNGFKDIEIFGGIGNRFDHTFSNVLSLNYALQNNVSARLVNKNNIIYLINSDTNNKTQIPKKYDYFSVFSLSNNSKITIDGAKYPLNNYLMKPFDNLAQSNEVAKENEFATVEVKNGTAIIVLVNE